MDPFLQPLIQFGALGIFSALLVIFAKSLLKREQDRGDSTAAEVQRLNTMIQDKVIPALITATQAIAASQAILQGIQYQKDIDAAAKANRPPEKTS